MTKSINNNSTQPSGENCPLSDYCRIMGVDMEALSAILRSKNELDESFIAPLLSSPKASFTYQHLLGNYSFTNEEFQLPHEYPTLSMLNFRNIQGSFSDLLLKLKVIDKRSLTYVQEKFSNVIKPYTRIKMASAIEIELVRRFGLLQRHNINTIFNNNLELRVFKKTAQTFGLPAFNSAVEFYELYNTSNDLERDNSLTNLVSSLSNIRVIYPTVCFYIQLCKVVHSKHSELKTMTTAENDLFELCSYVMATMTENHLLSYQLSLIVNEPNLTKLINTEYLETLPSFRRTRAIVQSPWLQKKVSEAEALMPLLEPYFQDEFERNEVRAIYKDFAINYLSTLLQDVTPDDAIESLLSLQKMDSKEQATSWIAEVNTKTKLYDLLCRTDYDLVSGEQRSLASQLKTIRDLLMQRLLNTPEKYTPLMKGDGGQAMLEKVSDLHEVIANAVDQTNEMLEKIVNLANKQDVTQLMQVTSDLVKTKESFNKEFSELGVLTCKRVTAFFEDVQHLDRARQTSLTEEEINSLLELAEQDISVLKDKVQKLNRTNLALHQETLSLKSKLSLNTDGISNDMAECLFGHPTVIHIVDVIKQQYPFVVFADDFDDTIAQCQYENPNKLFEMLYRLCSEYFPAILSGQPDSVSKEIFHGCYASRESNFTSNNKRFAQEREFKFNGETVMQLKHLTLGSAIDARKTVQVFFDISDEKQLRIGYIGAHLSTSSIKP